MRSDIYVPGFTTPIVEYVQGLPVSICAHDSGVLIIVARLDHGHRIVQLDLQQTLIWTHGNLPAVWKSIH